MMSINPGDHKSNGHYSAGMAANGMLYVSGQLSLDPLSRMPPQGGAQAHASVALANLDRVLQAAGLTRDRVVQCRVYLPDIGMWDEVNRVYAEFFGAHKPARVVVPTGPLHFGCLVEIEAVAELEVRP